MTTIQSELDIIKSELVELKRSQVSIAKAIIDQVNDNQYNTERLLNVLNANMVTVFSAVNEIASDDNKAKEESYEALNQQMKILEEAQKINISLRGSNEPKKLQKFERANAPVARGAQAQAQVQAGRGVRIPPPPPQMSQQEAEQKTDLLFLEQQLLARDPNALVQGGVLLNTRQNFEVQSNALARQKQVDTLNRGLRYRPAYDRLVQQQVVRSGFDQKVSNLDRAQKTDALQRNLQQRPGVNQLVYQRVLPDASNPIVAANLNAMKLRKQQQLLDEQLQNRPDTEQLLQKGIVYNTTSNFQDQSRAFRRSLKMDSLNRGLRNRSTVDALVHRNVLPDAENPALAARIAQQTRSQNQRILEEELFNRATVDDLVARGHLLNTTDNYHAMAQQLSAAKNRDYLNRTLKSRPAADQLVSRGVLPDADNPILAAQINRQRRQQNISQLDEALQQRVTQQDLVSHGIAYNTTVNYNQQREAFERSKQLDNLHRGLRNRPTVDELVRQRVLPDANNPVLAANLNTQRMKISSHTLEESLGNRPHPNELVRKGHLMNTNANFQGVTSQLQLQKMKDGLNRSLKNRPDVDALVGQRVLPDSQNPIVAALLKQHVLQQQKTALASKLGSRKTENELVDQGYLFNTLGNFNKRSSQLERQKNADAIKRGLRRRPSLEQLVDRRILYDANEPVLAAQMLAVRRRQQQQLLDGYLVNRKKAQELVDQGLLLNTNENYESVASALEKSIVADAISRGIRNRPQAAELKQQQILADSNVYSTLQANALALEQELQADRLNRQLRQRQDVQNLVDAGYLINSSQNYEKQRKLLERSQARDSISQTLRSRPSPNLLNLRNDIAANEVNSQNIAKYATLLNSYRTVMEQARIDLDKAQKTDNLHKKLRARADTDELAAKGIYKTNMEARRQSLTSSQRADVVNQQLKNRPDASDLANAGIYKSTMDQARKDLQVSQTADVVNQQLKNRPGAGELSRAGIYKSTMDQARQDLQVSQNADVINKQLKNRPDAAELSNVGIYKTTMDKARQELQVSQTADTINQQLKNRPDANELSRTGIYKSTMDQARQDLQVSQTADVINKQLKNRPEASQLSDAGIYKTQMDQARDNLQGSKKADAVNQQLKNRPGTNQLSQAGIYKSPMDQARQDLQSAKLADEMNQKLKDKPDVQNLKERQIYRTVSEDVSLQNETQQKKQDLNEKISNLNKNQNSADAKDDITG